MSGKQIFRKGGAEKFCTRCKEWHPYAPTHYRRLTSGGLYSRCIACERERGRESEAARRKAGLVQSRATQQRAQAKVVEMPDLAHCEAAMRDLAGALGMPMFGLGALEAAMRVQP